MTEYKFISVTPANDGVHKLSAKFVHKETGREKNIKFGATGYDDYTTFYKKLGKKEADEKKEHYIGRHAKDLKTGDHTKPGYLSMYILWNKPTVSASISDYRKRFFN
jgi:hypothetical protein